MLIYTDTDTGEIIDARDIRGRAPANVALKAEEFWDDAFLAEYGASIIDVVETDPPAVELPSYLSGNYSWDKSVPGQWAQVWEVIEPTLEQAKQFALGRLGGDFDTQLPPVDYDNKQWKPGHSSAAVIRDVAEMAELMGLTEVTLTDADDVEHVYTLENARLISAAIGAAYQQDFLLRAAKRRQIAEAASVEDALAVVWHDETL